MRSIADKIATRTAIPNNSAEVGFSHQTTEPVYKMLVHRHQHPGLRPVRQPDRPVPRRHRRRLRLCLLERNLRLGMAALDKNYTLQQSNATRPTRSASAPRRCSCKPRRKRTCCTRVGSLPAVASHLEQLERQLRSSMPQHVMDMLGQQAAYLSP